MSYFNRANTIETIDSNSVQRFTSRDVGEYGGYMLVQVPAANYSPVQGEYVIELLDTSAARTITLPDARSLPAGTEIVIKDGGGQANSNNITIATTANLVPDSDALLWQLCFAGSDLGTVVAATAAALAACTAAGSGVGKTLTANANGALSIDGVSPANTNLVLVKNQVNPVDNGLYTVTQAGDGSHPFILTRATTFDQTAEVIPGSVANISAGGTVNGSTKWALRGGIDCAKTAAISTSFGKMRLMANGRDWRVL